MFGFAKNNLSRFRIFLLVVAIATCLVSVPGRSSISQEIHLPLLSERIEAHLSSGEFSRAVEMARQLSDPVQADHWLGRIASVQATHGAKRGALKTAGLIDDSSQRFQAFELLASNQQNGGQSSAGFGNNPGPPQPPGHRGGITEADFDELMELIQEVIFPDSWEDAGGTGRMRPFASGVFVDSSGALNRIDSNALKDWNSVKHHPSSSSWQLDRSVELSKISINRLEQELMRLRASGKSPSDELRYLGGIYDLQYVMVYRETGDLVIAGAAGPWKFDAEGRAVNIETGRPVLQLDDFVVCLRNAWEGNGIFGCSIDPRQANLADVQEFQETTKLKGAAKKNELRDRMGLQDISVHGIDPRTHAGQVIVEADYRMKLIAMGLEETIRDVPSYLDRVTFDEHGELPPLDLLRLWFTMNYQGISASPEGDVYQIVGPAVKVQSETEFLGEQGERIQTGKAAGPAKTFAEDFTRHYDALVGKYSIYGELENIFDLSLATNLIRQKGLGAQIGWTPTFFASPSSSTSFNYEVALEPQPKVVASVVNDRIIRQTVGSRRYVHQVIGVSGGVEFDANRLVAEVKTDEHISAMRDLNRVKESNHWRWE